MTVQYRVTKILSTLILSTVLIAGLCSTPMLRAQQSNPTTSQPPATPQPAQTNTTQQPQAIPPAQTDQAQPGNATAPAQNDQNAAPANQNQPQQKPSPSGTTVNPSQAPLNPVTTYPDASDQPQQQPSSNATPAAPQTTTTIPEGPKPKPQSEPVGAATAESVPTAGGAAAKPAGVAIAPAKQHQTRSLMLKIGAVAAAGAALGTIFALSHSTSSVPPGTGVAGVTGH